MKGEDSTKSSTSIIGRDGGQWSACTHIKIYGMNFAVFFARHIAYGLKPKNVLEFGCGLGTTSDFLVRFAGSNVVCIEPESTMLAEVMNTTKMQLQASQKKVIHRPIQLSMFSFSKEAKDCSTSIFDTKMNFDLVLSLEVAEHIPIEFHNEFVTRMVDATTKYFIFAAARPKQGGTGHIEESMHTRTWWIEQFSKNGKLQYLPQLSRALRYVTAHADRAYDLGYNLIAMGVKDNIEAIDITSIPQIADDCSFFSPFELRYRKMNDSPEKQFLDDEELEYSKKHNLPLHLDLERPCSFPNDEQRKKHKLWVEGQEQALWPELDLLIRRVNNGELEC